MGTLLFSKKPVGELSLRDNPSGNARELALGLLGIALEAKR